MVTLLALDLGVLHKDDRKIGVRESLFLSAGYISMALLFGIWGWWFLGAQSGTEYFTGFLIALIFSYLAISRQYQHRVLFWGIMGVIALAAMIHRFKYLQYALALVLVFIGTKIFLVGIIGKIPPVAVVRWFAWMTPRCVCMPAPVCRVAQHAWRPRRLMPRSPRL